MDDWLQPLLRLLHYGVLLGLFGLIAYRVIGLRWLVSSKSNGWPKGVILGLAVLAPILSAALMLVSIAAMMGQSVWAVEWSTIQTMLATTDMGWAFLARFVLLSSALAALLIRHRLRSGLAVSAAFYGVALATLPSTGHAAASEGGIGLLHGANDVVHLIAAGLWLGAIGWFLYLVLLAHRNPDVDISGPLLNALHNFTPVGMTLVAIVVVTGLINAQLTFGLANSGTVFTNTYGQLLTAKIALVGLMLACGARNAVAGRRHQMGSGEILSAASTLAVLRTSLATEMTIGVAVVGLVAILGMLSPIG